MRLWVAASLFLLLPGCGGGVGGTTPPTDYVAYYVAAGALQRASVGGGTMTGVETIDSGITSWGSVPHKSISGATVTYPSAVQYVAYLKGGQIFRFDTSEAVAPGTNPRRVSSETSAGAIVAFADVQQVETQESTTHVFYTTLPSGGTVDFHETAIIHDDTEAPADLELGVPDTTTFELKVPTNAANYAYYLARGATGTVKRVNMVLSPIVTIHTMSGTDDVVEFMPRNYQDVVYRRSSGELMKSRVTGVPDPTPSVLYAPAAAESVLLKGKVDVSVLEGEIYFTSHVDTDFDTVPDTVSLWRVLFDAGTVAPIDGPYSYTALTMNEIRFTGAGVVWAHQRDATSHIRWYDRAAPATSFDLLTAGRALAATGVLQVTYDGTTYRIVFGETSGADSYRVCKEENGTLVNEAFVGTVPGPVEGVYSATAWNDSVLDLFFADPTSRLVYAAGFTLRSRTLDLAPVSELQIGLFPGDVTGLAPGGGFATRGVVGGTAAGPQTDIFAFHAATASSLVRITNTPATDESPIAPN